MDEVGRCAAEAEGLEALGAQVVEDLAGPLEDPDARRPVVGRYIQMDASDRESPLVAHRGVELDERPVVGQEVVEDLEKDRPPILNLLAQAPFELHPPERWAARSG